MPQSFLVDSEKRGAHRKNNVGPFQSGKVEKRAGDCVSVTQGISQVYFLVFNS